MLKFTLTFTSEVFLRVSVFHNHHQGSYYMCFAKFIIISKSKRKAIPLQAWTGPEFSSGLRLPDFKTIGTRKC